MVDYARHQPQPTSPWANDLHRLQDNLERSFLQVLSFPPGAIIPAYLTAEQVSGGFDDSGKGKRGTPYDGWLICNGSNGTPRLHEKFLRFSASAAGGEGGSDSSAHTHSGEGLYAHISLLSNKIVIDDQDDAPDFDYNQSVTATGYARTAPDSGTEFSAAAVGGSTDAASADDNRPAYYELVPLMRAA